MENTIVQLDNGDFEVLPVKEEPYVFARDLEIVLKIADDKRRKEEVSPRDQTEDQQRSRQRNSYVSRGEWGYGHRGD